MKHIELSEHQLVLVCDAISTEIEQTEEVISLLKSKGLTDSANHRYLVNAVEELQGIGKKLQRADGAEEPGGLRNV